MVNKLIVDGLNITLNESTALPFTYTFSTAGVHQVRIGLDDTEEICAYAFKDCTELTKVKFPSKITMIKRNAFENCESLKSIDIPSTIKYVGPNVFDGCSKLSEINFEDTTPPNFLTNLEDDVTCYIPDGSKFVLADELVKDGSVQYYSKNELGGYDEVDYEALEDGNEYYYDGWLGVHNHLHVVENRFKNKPVEVGFYDGDVKVTVFHDVEQGTEDDLYEVRFTPENTTNTNIYYISSNPGLVTVSQEGHITMAKNVAGRSTIYVCTEPDYNGTYVSATLNVRVTNNTGIQKIDPELSWSTNSLTITSNEDELPTLTNTNNVNVTYESSNEEVATIDNNGEITIIANGTTTIKAIFNGSDVFNSKEVSYELIINIAELEPEEPEQNYTVIFKDGDEILKTITGPTGTPVSASDITLEKEGYEFNGWSINGTSAILPVDAIIDTDLTYIALWIEVQPEEPEPDIEADYESENGEIQIINPTEQEPDIEADYESENGEIQIINPTEQESDIEADYESEDGNVQIVNPEADIEADYESEDGKIQVVNEND